MKITLGILILIWGLGAAAQVQDVNYHFDKNKLSSAKSPLEFFRTFVDYFYLLEKQNQQQQAYVGANWAQSGWCFGDAHLENFGTLLLNSGKSLFTVNDWDDAGPCPVVLEVFRLAISAKLYNSQLQVDGIYRAYTSGLNQQTLPVPSAIQHLLAKNQQKGEQPHPKSLKNGRFLRSSASQELSADERSSINQILFNTPSLGLAQFKWIDGIRTSKEDGGSFGMVRYQILLQNLQNTEKLLHLEFKEQTVPSIYPVLRSPTLPTVMEKISTSIKITQGEDHSRYYGVFQVLGKSMLLRPRFNGNESVNMDDYSLPEVSSILAYEANLLGLLHRTSMKSLKPSNRLGYSKELSDFVLDVSTMAHFIEQKYNLVSGHK